jgi:hypothetical protein
VVERTKTKTHYGGTENVEVAQRRALFESKKDTVPALAIF